MLKIQYDLAHLTVFLPLNNHCNEHWSSKATLSNLFDKITSKFMRLQTEKKSSREIDKTIFGRLDDTLEL